MLKRTRQSSRGQEQEVQLAESLKLRMRRMKLLMMRLQMLMLRLIEVKV
jgi:hypothetical protein